MNSDGENGAGAPSMHYGHPQLPLHQATSQPFPPPQQPQHIPGTNAATYGAHSILMNNATSNSRRRIGEEDQDHLRSGIQPTPLFERLVTEEVQELKAYARIIENQNRRLAELERVHGDLEARLEQECNARMKLEATLEQHELGWTDKYNKLQKERDHWKEVVQLEQTKNSRLIEQVVRKEKDIQKMLQRKYDQPQDGGHFNQSSRGTRQGTHNEKERSSTPIPSASRSPSVDHHKSPFEQLLANGSAEAAHPKLDPDEPRSTSPRRRDRFKVGYHDNDQTQQREVDDQPHPVLGSRVWEEMTKSKSEIFVVDETSITPEELDALQEELVEHGSLIVEDTFHNDENSTPRNSDSSNNPLNRLATWGSSVMTNLMPGKLPEREAPPPDWEKPKPGFKHAETQTII